MESTNATFSVIDFQTGKEKAYVYDSEDTILELKRKIAKEENYEDEDGAKVQLFWACFPLKDTELARNYVDKEEGIFVQFKSYPTACKADGDTFIWLGKKKCVKLYAAAEENIPIPRNGHFTVMRSKLVNLTLGPVSPEMRNRLILFNLQN